MNNEYGPVYEITGFSELTPESVNCFENDLVKHFLKKGSVAGSLSGSGWLRVYLDRNSEYPDLDFEVSPHGRLFVCDMDVHKKALLPHLRNFIKQFKKLSFAKILDAATGTNVTDVATTKNRTTLT